MTDLLEIMLAFAPISDDPERDQIKMDEDENEDEDKEDEDDENEDEDEADIKKGIGDDGEEGVEE